MLHGSLLGVQVAHKYSLAYVERGLVPVATCGVQLSQHKLLRGVKYTALRRVVF
jgi:hypothetical protein